MRILAIADRGARKSIKSILEENRIDMICTLGDLDGIELHELANITDIPKIGVYGNHCSGSYFEKLGIKNMHLETFSFQGVTFGGFEGSVRYKPSEYAKMYTQEEAEIALKDFPRVEVMISHCPPYGINDDLSELAHTGFKALRDYLERAKPKYFLHGHTYPNNESLVTKFKETEIIFIYQDKIIDI